MKENEREVNTPDPEDPKRSNVKAGDGSKANADMRGNVMEAPPEDNLGRIRQVSEVFSRLCTACIVALPILSAGYWANYNTMDLPRVGILTDPLVPEMLSSISRLMAFVVSLIPISIVVYGLAALRRLFRLYSMGRIFTKGNVRCFRGIGIASVLWVAAGIVHDFLFSIAVTIDNPPEDLLLRIDMDSFDFTALLLGGVFLVISWVMDEARRLEEDQSQII